MLLTNTSSFCNLICSINGTTTSPCLDVSLLVQNHALLQSPPTAARHGYHFITAAQATQQMNYRVPEEGKNGGNDTSNMEGERKADMVGGQTPLTVGQSIVFSWLYLTDSSVSTMPVKQFAAAASIHSETPTTSNGSVYSDHISSSSSIGTKLPNALLHLLKILFKAAVAVAVMHCNRFN
ncbi:hypothetical protein POTOM_013204 [Populus tomentosa]|uniref:Uncharacterized protein n=1 Tax=Populus tomentosa TaxID=118781 RepID=A0A8X8D773_POPTO|nr:hypothetical protein POTOM_013204 [Populus tomentosa]